MGVLCGSLNFSRKHGKILDFRNGSFRHEIAQAIALLDQKIASLKKLRDQLAEEFGEVQAGTEPRILSTVTMSGNGYMTRKDQVAKFLREHGPSTRSEIIAGTGIPAGTAAYVLNDEKRFVSQHGKWQVLVQSSSA